jgi:phenylalanyl-tRNA synthetase beta chain
MRIPQIELTKLAPALEKTQPETILESLNNLGFETQILEGESIVYELTITPNRGDALSVIGVARELLAGVNRKTTLRLIEQDLVDALPDLNQPVITLKSTDCTQYHAVILEHVTVQPSPKWLQEAVSLFGHRPINNIVDITNYLMELYGQPLHAFDLDAILGGTITLRTSHEGEVITTLDGIERKLGKGALVVEDEKGLIDLAGIMGGANSAVDHRTKRVLLQSAIFDPASMKRAAEAAKHSSTAQYRYVRGIDPLISLPVLNEAIKLAKKKEFGSMKAVGKIIVQDSKSSFEKITFDADKINRLLGTTLAKKDQIELLEKLGCTITESNGKSSISAPSWRFDLDFWQDYAEEISRLVGITDSIPTKRLPKLAAGTIPISELAWTEGIKDRLVELGFTEIYSYSFVSKEDLSRFQLHKVGELINPLNPQLKYLRPSLMPNLAAAIGKNSFFEPVLLFEIGHVFTHKDEQVRLGIAIASQKEQLETWTARIADAFGIDSSELLSAAITTTISDDAAKYYRVRKLPAYLIEIPLDKLQNARRIPYQYFVPTSVAKYKKISKFPPIVRDMSLIVSLTQKGQEVVDYIAKFHPFVEYVTIFDEFVSSKIGENKKSIALHILYSSPEKTLNQVEIEEVERELVSGLQHSFEAIIR